MNYSLKEIISGSLLGLVGKILAAIVNFISLPILIAIYSKSGYGLIAVALSANTFLQIVNMGVPMGAVKFFSEWRAAKNYIAIEKGMQSNLFFFVVVGIINSLILFYLGYYADDYFKVSNPQVLSTLLYALAIISFPNWYFITLQHLLMAYEKITVVNFGNSLASILNILATAVAYFFNAPIEVYFSIFLGTNLIVIPINLYVSFKMKILKASFFLPYFHKEQFNIIMKYSLGLFGLSGLQFLATQSPPIILSTMLTNGDTAVADYRIMLNITMLVSIMAGIFLQNFIPYISKINYSGDFSQIRKFVFDSTRLLSFFVFYICFFVAFNSTEILTSYVGATGSELGTWLCIWILGFLFLNNQGISSVIFSVGRFKEITFATLLATIVSMFISLTLVKIYGVGVAALSFLIYKTIEAVFIFGYYLPKVAKISPLEVFHKSIKAPLVISICSIGIFKILGGFIFFSNVLLYLLFSGIGSLIIFIVAIYFKGLNDPEKVMVKAFFAK